MEWNPPGFYLKKNRMTKIKKLCRVSPRFDPFQKSASNFTIFPNAIKPGDRKYCQKTGLWYEVKFVRRYRNFDYENSFTYREIAHCQKCTQVSPFLSSYIHANSAKNRLPKMLQNRSETTVNKALSEDGKLRIENECKYFSVFQKWWYETRFCEWKKPIRIEEFTSSAHASQYSKIYKALVRIGEKYDKEWKAKKVTPLFWTLTNEPMASVKLDRFLEKVKRELKKGGIAVRDYVAVREVSKENDHPHYHVLMYVDRLNLAKNGSRKHIELMDWEYNSDGKRFDKWSKMWGQFVHIEIEKKNNAKGYLTSGALGYINRQTKGSAKICGLRRYSKSRGL